MLGYMISNGVKKGCGIRELMMKLDVYITLRPDMNGGVKITIHSII